MPWRSQAGELKLSGCKLCAVPHGVQTVEQAILDATGLITQLNRLKRMLPCRLDTSRTVNAPVTCRSVLILVQGCQCQRPGVLLVCELPCCTWAY